MLHQQNSLRWNALLCILGGLFSTTLSSPVRADFTITDTQLNPFSGPGPIGPYQSKDDIYWDHTDLQGLSLYVRYWNPGFAPIASDDEHGGMQEAMENIGNSANAATGHCYDTSIWGNILFWSKGPYPDNTPCRYCAHGISYGSPVRPNPSYIRKDAYGPMLSYPWIQQR